MVAKNILGIMSLYVELHECKLHQMFCVCVCVACNKKLQDYFHDFIVQLFVFFQGLQFVVSFTHVNFQHINHVLSVNF